MAITDPSDITNLVAWHDASDTASISHSGGNVSSIAAQTGFGNALDDAVGSPVTGTRTLNSLNVIDFDGDARLKNNPSSGAAGSTFTSFCVGKSDGSTGSNQFLFSAQGSDSSGIVGVDAGNWSVNCGTLQSTSDAIDTDAHYFIFVCNGASSALWIDGVEHTVGDPGTNGYAADGVWGANAYDGAFLDGYVGEAGVYSRVLTGGEIADLNAYMALKWFGVGGGAPSSKLLLLGVG